MEKQIQKQLIIGLVFVLIIGAIAYGFVGYFFFVEPTCFDKVQNGQEEGVDCGLLACGITCEPAISSLSVTSQKLIEVRPNDYDFVAEIKNPHTDYGSSEVAYELKLLNGNNQELLTKEGIFYILPNQTKFLILPFLTTEQNVSEINFKIKSAVWQKIDSMSSVTLAATRQSYIVLDGGNSSSLEAVILNDSDFDFDTIDIDIALRNKYGSVIAVNKSEINTLLAHTERGFKVVWPFPINEDVAEIEIIPTTNLFDNSNFIKRYGSGLEQFQQY